MKGNLPAGPVFSLLLVGLLLLSGLLYYRAVNVQRFLEPALALSLPRSELAQRLSASLQQEFSEHAIRGVKLRSSSIIVDQSLLFTPRGVLRDFAPVILKKVARVYLSALDEQTRPNVSMVLVIARYPAQRGEMGAIRIEHQRQASKTLDALFDAEPELAKQFGRFFTSAAIPASLVQDPDTIEFQIIPSELMHAGVLQQLVKYVE
jgi:hypothetical protein